MNENQEIDITTLDAAKDRLPINDQRIINEMWSADQGYKVSETIRNGESIEIIDGSFKINEEPQFVL